MSEHEPPDRTRTITWHDPMALAETTRTMPGIEYLKAQQSGALPPPPIAVALGFSLSEVSEGRAAFTMEPAEYHYNPIGTVHGGVAATLLDSAMGCAISSMLSAEEGYTTLEIKVNYVRPITRNTGLLRCEGTIIHIGGRIATAEGKLIDSEGKLYAHATTTCMLFRA